MKVRSVARITGSNQTIDVELEDSDMQDIPDWMELPLAKRFQVMTQRADSLVIEYMYRNNHISKEFAQQRMGEIRDGLTS